MSLNTRQPTTTITRCHKRRDGQWICLTRDGESVVASVDIPAGTRVTIRDGKAYRPK